MEFGCYHAEYWKLAIDLVWFCFVFHECFTLKVFGFWTSILEEFFFFVLEKDIWRKKVFVIFVHIYICDQWMERIIFSGKLEMKWLYEKFHFIKRKCFVRLVLTSYTSVDSSRSWYKGIIFKRVETPTVNMVLPMHCFV